MKNKLTIIILLFGLAKLLIHLVSNTNYGLHRDEFLYYEEGQHLAWGYMEVPPFTPFLAKLADLLGGSVFSVRLFPALTGSLIVIITGFLVKQLGGKTWAIVFACVALVLSPALSWTNTLFQPVSFNQFFWFLSAFLIIQIVRSDKFYYWYVLGVVSGVAFLNKYSFIFYIISLIIALAVSGHRKLLTKRGPYIAFCIASITALPNIMWQINHNFPVLEHMQTLSQNQLVNVNWFQFLRSQLSFHFASSIIWVFGLIGLFKIENLKSYRFAAIALFITVLLIGLLSGKDYYTAGAFLILFSFGGLTIEKSISNNLIRKALLIALLLISIPFLPYSLPILKIDKMTTYCAFMKDEFGVIGPLRWEDGNLYELPQDMADMNGWEELAQKVATIYHGLDDKKKKSCLLYGGGYAHASSINFFRKKYDLPIVHSFNSSYIIWIPTEVDFDNQIMIDDQKQTTASRWFNSMTLVDSIQNPFAREIGYIYYRENPKLDVNKEWQKQVIEAKEKHNFK